MNALCEQIESIWSDDKGRVMNMIPREYIVLRNLLSLIYYHIPLTRLCREEQRYKRIFNAPEICNKLDWVCLLSLYRYTVRMMLYCTTYRKCTRCQYQTVLHMSEYIGVPIDGSDP